MAQSIEIDFWVGFSFSTENVTFVFLNRSRRGSASVLVQPSGQGNADLGGGPDPREKALKRALLKRSWVAYRPP